MLNITRRSLLLLHRWAWTHSKTTLFLVFVFFTLTSFGLNKLQFLLSIDDLIDPDFQSYKNLTTLNSEFNDKNTVLLSLESQQPFTKEYLCELQKWILDSAQKFPEIDRIQTTFGVRQATIQRERFKMESFLNVDCFSTDPENEKIKNAFIKIQQSPWKGILTTKENYTLSLNFVLYDPQDKKFGTLDVKIVPELQKSFQNDFLKNNFNDHVEHYWAGITTFQSYLRMAFEQTQLLNMLMFVISLLIFRIFLGSWKAGFLFNGTIFISMSITYGIMGFMNIPVDVLTNSTGLMMIVGCLEDFIFVIFGMLRFRWNFRKSLRKFMLPSFFTSLTTAIGFASLVTSDLSTIRRFGLISAFAAMLEWAMVYLFLPALFKKFPKIGQIQFSPPKLNLKFTQKNIIPRWLAITLCIPILVPFIWIDHIHINDSPKSFFFKDHVVLKTTDHFLKTRGWLTEVSLVFNYKNSDDENRALIKNAKNFKAIEIIEDSYSQTDYMTEGLASPEKKAVLDLMESTSYNRRLKSDDGAHRAQLFLNTMEMDEIEALIQDVDSLCAGEKCYIVGSLISYNEFSVKILSTLFSSLGLSVILVVLLLISLRQNLPWSQLFALVVSSIWGPLILLTLFIVFKIPMTFVSCICASLLEGLAGDNAIQFIFSNKKGNLDQSVDSLSEGSLIVTVGMILLISVFLLSTIASMAVLGIYILVGLVFAFIGDVWILKGLLKQNTSSSSNLT